MERTFLVTGAAGHLGSTIIRELLQQKENVRGLILPCEKRIFGDKIEYYEGDICNENSLSDFFDGLKEQETICIHTAGIVDISSKMSQRMLQANVKGTENIIRVSRRYHIKRLVYISSVHAIPENDDKIVRETNQFSAGTVIGAYAKTKAEATKQVLLAGRSGMDVVVVHPSGIIGPYDSKHNLLVQMLNQYIQGKLRVCVKGGYDMVDVRDAAHGCILAALKGQSGQCYILSNRYYELRDILGKAALFIKKQSPKILPFPIAAIVAHFHEKIAISKGKRPLFTPYSLYTLKSNARFSNQKAVRELGYTVRSMDKTIQDTILWLNNARKSMSWKSCDEEAEEEYNG